jgi:hypothetical protein
MYDKIINFESPDAGAADGESSDSHCCYRHCADSKRTDSQISGPTRMHAARALLNITHRRCAADRNGFTLEHANSPSSMAAVTSDLTPALFIFARMTRQDGAQPITKLDPLQIAARMQVAFCD